MTSIERGIGGIASGYRKIVEGEVLEDLGVYWDDEPGRPPLQGGMGKGCGVSQGVALGWVWGRPLAFRHRSLTQGDLSWEAACSFLNGSRAMNRSKVAEPSRLCQFGLQQRCFWGETPQPP